MLFLDSHLIMPKSSKKSQQLSYLRAPAPAEEDLHDPEVDALFEELLNSAESEDEENHPTKRKAAAVAHDERQKKRQPVSNNGQVRSSPRSSGPLRVKDAVVHLYNDTKKNADSVSALQEKLDKTQEELAKANERIDVLEKDVELLKDTILVKKTKSSSIKQALSFPEEVRKGVQGKFFFFF